MADHAITATALVVADESAVEPFVTGGLCRLPSDRLDEAVDALAKVKEARGISADAEIHCRILFNADARARSPCKDLSVEECVELVAASVKAMNSLGGMWFGCWVDRSRYPRELRLLNGRPFHVEAKHLAGIMVQSALTHVSSDYQLAFDADPTKIDWGLARMQQATHFARVHPRAVRLPISHQSLLEMADVAAYTLAQSLIAGLKPNNRKARNFKGVLEIMQMRISYFEYSPEQPRH